MNPAPVGLSVVFGDEASVDPFVGVKTKSAGAKLIFANLRDKSDVCADAAHNLQLDWNLYPRGRPDIRFPTAFPHNWAADQRSWPSQSHSYPRR